MFVDATFPQGLMPYFTKEISYVSNVNIALSGLEFRKNLKPTSTTIYKLYTAIKKSEDISLLEAFFHKVMGKVYSFKLYDENDCQITKAPPLIIDGKTLQIQKPIIRGGQVMSEQITKPKNGTIAVFQNNIQINTGFTADYSSGRITFANDITNANILISCNYFKHVRFDCDSFITKPRGDGAFEIENITIKTVIN